MANTIFTTSWDDGHKLDLKLANLLNKYGIKGTFYIPQNIESRLSDLEIKEISQTQEIGAHTINHVFLKEVDFDVASREISQSKIWLESLFGNEIKMFCYPKGQYDKTIEGEVRRVDFIGARTTEKGVYNVGDFNLPVSLQVYPFPFRKKDAQKYHLSSALFQPLYKNYKFILNGKLPLRSFLSWNNFAEEYFRSVVKNGGQFHLWGHSWEIEKYGMWQDLEKFFKFVSQQKDISFLTNSEFIEYENNGLK